MKIIRKHTEDNTVNINNTLKNYLFELLKETLKTKAK